MKTLPKISIVFSLSLGLFLTSGTGWAEDIEPTAVQELSGLPEPGQGQLVEVVNGDFEQGLFNWGGKGVLDENVAHGGSNSLRLEKGFAFQPPSRKLVVWVKPGLDYRLSVWIRTEDCQDDGVTVTVNPWIGDEEGKIKGTGWIPGDTPSFVHDGGQSPALIATGGTHDWKRFEAVIPASQIPEAAAMALVIYLRHDAAADPTGTAWFDDVTVEQLPE